MTGTALGLRLAAGALAASLATLVPSHAQEPIRIGFAGALTGPAAFVGVEIKRGAEIAIDEINAKGGIKGRKLLLVSRDDEHNPVKTVAQYRELVEREKVVAIVGATNSASMLAVTPIVNDTLKVPVICPATDATTTPRPTTSGPSSAPWPRNGSGARSSPRCPCCAASCSSRRTRRKSAMPSSACARCTG